ncbi:allophanate hydrolase subunit 1 [Vibrio sp. ZSDE26]|uniref:Allophanate hydrolase subunit 1 n=1 Tax=Vibrio amylolyticus TaxID=2847292 RepID=A0A9X1XJ02_9VIBR|nr:allophanate hydrolase subunit 1 [Vibrio amylolyticus]MCK6263897.1 allophanate hydrolase subunit 1 [Vibrio amylolyticus]
MNCSIDPVAECSVLVSFDCESSKSLSLQIGACATAILESHSDWIMNITPSYRTILVDYLPHRVSLANLIQSIEQTLKRLEASPFPEKESIVLPAFYDESTGPDLYRYFNDGLSLKQIIELHTQQTYTVSAIGFAPGFAFLTSVHSTLQKPRLDTPRVSVAKGSIAIANNQTAVYPNQSPGGWNIIGNCPIPLYNPLEQPMTPFSIGSIVRFKSVSKEAFLSLGGVIPGKDV